MADETWRKWLWLGGALACLAGAAMGAALLDVANEGPYTRWYNQTMYDLSRAAGLDGDTAERAKRVLGAPTYVHTVNTEATYYYAPIPFVERSQFVVHTREGMVVSFQTHDGVRFP